MRTSHRGKIKLQASVLILYKPRKIIKLLSLKGTQKFKKLSTGLRDMKKENIEGILN